MIDIMSEKYPTTLAVRELLKYKVTYTPHLYAYEEKGGARASAEAFQISEHIVIKTLIMEDDKKSPLIVLMHGDLEVSTKNLARILNVKSITPCEPKTADKYSGYLVGGTSPFGTKRKMPIYMEKSILELEVVYINGGKRGFLVSLSPNEIVRVLRPTLVDVGTKS